MYIELRAHWTQSPTNNRVDHLGHSIVVRASNVSKHPEDDYQHGGSMMAVVGLGVKSRGLSYEEVGIMKVSLSYWLTGSVMSMEKLQDHTHHTHSK